MEALRKKSQVFIVVEIIEYVPYSVVIKSIIKSAGNVSAVSFDSGEALTEKHPLLIRLYR